MYGGSPWFRPAAWRVVKTACKRGIFEPATASLLSPPRQIPGNFRTLSRKS